jgi:hypothetical protein
VQLLRERNGRFLSFRLRFRGHIKRRALMRILPVAQILLLREMQIERLI